SWPATSTESPPTERGRRLYQGKSPPAGDPFRGRSPTKRRRCGRDSVEVAGQDRGTHAPHDSGGRTEPGSPGAACTARKKGRQGRRQVDHQGAEERTPLGRRAAPFRAQPPEKNSDHHDPID